MTPAETTTHTQAPWHAVWTHSHCEQLVCDQLAARGLHPFLPRTDVWSTRRGHRRLISSPLFPGYVFLNDALDKATHLEVLRARGVVRVLGEGWERPAVVPEAEIEDIRRLTASGLSVRAHPYLREGRRVRLVTGPLAGVEGILLKARDRGVLVVSVNLLQRSVAVEVDWSQVAAA